MNGWDRPWFRARRHQPPSTFDLSAAIGQLEDTVAVVGAQLLISNEHFAPAADLEALERHETRPGVTGAKVVDGLEYLRERAIQPVRGHGGHVHRPGAEPGQLVHRVQRTDHLRARTPPR